MTISRFGRWIVGIAAAIGTVIGAAKSIRDIAEHLNGWHVLLGLSLLVLIGLGMDWFHTWLERQFNNLRSEIETIRNTRTVPVESTPDPQPLRTRTLALCDELRDWLRRLGPKPKEEWHANMEATEFIDKYMSTVQPWQMTYFHGFHLKFAGRVEALYHELGICALGSNDLEAAFARMCKGVSDPQENDATVIADQLAELATKL